MKLSGKRNINPNVWGPTFWDTLHFTAFGYPNNPNEIDKDSYKHFIISYVKILPCDRCSVDAYNHVSMISDFEWNKILKDRDSLIKWTWDFHDSVNKKLNKVSPKLNTFVTQFIEKKSPYKPSWRTFFNTMSIFIFLILIALFYARFLRTTR
jgi:hypothetical protein|tara:strand:+ start:187 stop:642 length:456 start_codon:yes stop_codon:yes gene_type:complete